MQGIHGTITDISLERGRDSARARPPAFLGAFVAATVGCLAAYALHNRYENRNEPVSAEVVARTQASSLPAAQPEPAVQPAPTVHPAPSAVEDPETLFGAMIVEPEWRAEIALTPEPIAPTMAPPTTLTSLGAGPPAPAALPPVPLAPTVASLPASAPEAAPYPPMPPAATAAPSVAVALPEAIPLPPIRDVPQIDDIVPLPPARPSEFAEPLPNPAVPERRVALPSPGPAAAPADERNVFQKLLGLGQPSGSVVASRPPAQPVQPARPGVWPTPQPPAAAATTVVARPPAAGEGRGGFGGLFSAFSSSASMSRLGYDRQTAVYVISAHAVYLPDGSRLEAHSGLGDRLDDVRYVHERARGPTPPHLYELTMREALFHGVQAIRLNPVGEGGVYGRAGLLAHPYMLGPNGESNGCVSFKDYNAFLRAYQNGEVNKLAVVTRL